MTNDYFFILPIRVDLLHTSRNPQPERIRSLFLQLMLPDPDPRNKIPLFGRASLRVRQRAIIMHFTLRSL